MPASLRFAAICVLLSSCAVREDYAVRVDGNNRVSLETKKVHSWLGEDVEELPYQKPLGSDEGHGQWSASQGAAEQNGSWQNTIEEGEARSRFGHDR